MSRLYKYLLAFLFIGVFEHSFGQNSCSTTTTGNWNNSSIWSCDPGVSPPPIGDWANGNYIDVNHAIEIPNNIIIDLSSSGTLELRLNANLTFNSNSKLILPSGAKIIIASGVTIGRKGNSSGTLIEIGGNGIWGRECESEGCTNNPLTGPGIMDENSTPGNPLPVELITFTAQATEDQVIIYWSTASELDNDFFTLERSRNGKDFKYLASIEGNGTVHTQIDYSYTDRDPHLGLSYYRLTQTDYDGTSERFPAINVLFTPGSTLSAFPNPVLNDNLKIKSTGYQKNEAMVISILDLQGKRVMEYHVTSDEFGNLESEINLEVLNNQHSLILEINSSKGKEFLKIQKL